MFTVMLEPLLLIVITFLFAGFIQLKSEAEADWVHKTYSVSIIQTYFLSPFIY